MNFRIGHGYDVHKFSDKISPGNTQSLILAGVQVPHNRRLVAHSDGDVVIHGLCDAMLGALAAGDLGTHFPDTDERYRNVDSTTLLEQVVAMAKKDNWHLVNADITVVAQEPKLAPFIHLMRTRLSKLLFVEMDCMNIKATTTEGLGFVGRKEGIASYAVVLLGKNET